MFFSSHRYRNHGRSWKISYLLLQTQESQMSCLHRGNSALLHLGTSFPRDSEAKGRPRWHGQGTPVLTNPRARCCTRVAAAEVLVWQMGTNNRWVYPEYLWKRVQAEEMTRELRSWGWWGERKQESKISWQEECWLWKRVRWMKRGEKTDMNYID